MCGRYYFVLDESKEAHRLKDLLSKYNLFHFEQGEIFPAQEVLALVLEQDTFIPKVKTWGVEMKQTRIINARSETIQDKKLFQNMQRCVIPCNAFYEWKQAGKHKTKYKIKKTESDMMYLAGLCSEENVVIVTGESIHEMKKLHSRTPILLHLQDIKHYLNGGNINVDNENLEMEAIGNSEQMLFDL